MRVLPLVLSLALLGVIIVLWPSRTVADLQVLAWVNIALLFFISVLLFLYGLRLLFQKTHIRPGSRLRAKLVIGLVGMLLIPAGTLQIAANQMVEKGMNVWFDVRVDTLLDRALSLAQGFYERIDHDLRQNLAHYMHDSGLLTDIANLPASYSNLNARMIGILQHEGWQSIQFYDRNGRLVAAVQSEGLSSFEAEPFSEQALLSLTMDKVSSELFNQQNEEMLLAYAPIRIHQRIVGLIKVKVTLPLGLIQHARAVESDYTSYKGLERHRQSIRDLFTHAMLFITLIIVFLVGLVALGFSRRLTSPIGHLAHALKKITDGDLDVSIPNAPNDELGDLVLSFNRMALHMKQNVEALEKAQLDLSEALSSSRQRQYVLETLLANLQSGVLLLNEQGEIRLINQSLRNLLTLQPNDWVSGRNFSDLSRGKLHLIHDFYDELSHQQNETLQRELEVSIQGEKRHLLARGARLNASGLSGFSGYLLLLDDVSQLAEAQRHRAWSEVAQRLAHEIKNPLTPIKLAAERLQRRFRKQVDHHEVFDACTHAIISQVERLQRLIVDFSTLARLPKPYCKQVLCKTFIHELCDLYSAYPRVCATQVDSDIHCYCDADQVRQILINLMENALAATSDSQNQIRLYLSQDDQMVYFHIEDDGLGIPREVQDHMFEAYYSTKAEGSGLGLSIAKRIADEHGGALSLISSSQPTHFCLSLPMQKQDPKPSNAKYPLEKT
ncbi:MAG: ATP-binding protein [Mariprofundaceae bacterium]|nr:ATP-binding protein [Mariprofundaceae bacterium]